MTSTARIASQRAEARVAAILPELVEIRREIARLQAVEASLLAHAGSIAADWAAESDPRGTSGSEFPHRSVAAEIAAAWRVSDRTVQRRIGDAAALVEEFPETHAALAAGENSAAHARIIVSTGTIIERPELRAEFEGSVLDYAKAESASRLGPIAKRRAEWFTESSFEERHRRARESRRTWLEDLDDGMSILHLLGPTILVHAAHQRATDSAHAVRNHASDAAPDDSAALDDSGADDRPETSGEITGTADDAATADDTGTAGDTGTASGAATESPAVVKDTRTIDQLRCDILFDLVLAGQAAAHDTGLAAIRPTVSVTVPVLALIDDGIRDPFDAAELDGHGPIDTDTARMLAGAASGWERVLTHPITGGRPGRRPVHPQRAAPPAPTREGPALQIPGMPHAHTTMRYRSHHRSRHRRRDHRRESRAPVPKTSHAEASDRMARQATPRRRARVDQPGRHLVHRPARQYGQLHHRPRPRPGPRKRRRERALLISGRGRVT